MNLINPTFLFFLTAWDDFLEGFLIDPNVKNGVTTAAGWFWVLVFTVLVTALGSIIYKAVKKSRARQPEEKIWTRADTLKLVGFGSVFLFVFQLAWLWAKADYWDYIGSVGLIRGFIGGLVSYLFFFFLAHLVPSWRREL